MKKTIISLFAICLGMFQTANAANTDISTIDNVVYIEPISVAAGSQYIISVKMKNSVTAQGYGFDLYLPEGASFVVDEYGLPVVEMSTERTTDSKTDTFNSFIRPNESLRLFASSTGGQTIEGHDGEIAKVTIKVSATMAQGDYPLILKKVTVTDNNAVGYDTDEVETTLTITALLIDENATSVPAAATGVDVRVKRTIAAGVWNTICLPFAMTEEQVKDVFGDDVELGDFDGCDSEYDANDKVTGLTVKFKSAKDIKANHPYIIKVNTENDIEEFTVDGVDIAVEANPSVELDKKVDNTNVLYNSFIGTYVNTMVPKKALFLYGNKFWYSTGETKMKGLRGYFNFYDVLDSYGTNTNARMKIVLNETTGIEGMRAGENEGMRNEWYTLDGRILQGEPTMKGAYVNNGRVIIK